MPMVYSLFKWLLKKLFFLTLVVGIAGFVALVGVFWYFGKDLPSYEELSSYDPATITRIMDSNGDITFEYAKEQRIYTSYDDIPPLVINAFLAAEDYNYFNHPGIDLQSLFRATLQNVLHYFQNKRFIGGSTITQQVVKDFLLTNERTLSRKIKEAILAYRITKAYSKERILELYLNKIYLGNHSYGIASASLNYFNKELAQLSVSEAAMLAALPKAPTFLNPYKNYGAAKARRDWVINKMAYHGLITEDEAIVYTDMPISLSRGKVLSDKSETFYTEKVRQEAIKEVGEDAFYTKGLFILTQQDSKLQKLATNVMAKALERYDRAKGWRGPIGYVNIKENGWHDTLSNFRHYEAYNQKFKVAVIKAQSKNGIKAEGFENKKYLIKDYEWICGALKDPEKVCVKAKVSKLKPGDIVLIKRLSSGSYTFAQMPEVEGAMVVMEPGTGKVLAMVGGYSFARSKFNRALQATRQLGSVLKPFVYLAALEQGYPPNSIILDDPIELEQGVNLPTWTPRNYSNDFLGPITLRTALERSRNVATVRLLTKIGLKPVSSVIRRLNIYRNIPATYSMALGAYETTLLQITNAYNSVASGGVLTTPNFIGAMYDRQGNLLYKDKYLEVENKSTFDESFPTYDIPKPWYNYPQVIDKEINYQLVHLLKGTVQRGTARRARIKGLTLAAKTGTTNNSMDAWVIGFSKNLTVGVYVGYDNPQTLGNRVTGATLAIPIFKEFMQNAHKGVADEDFDIPEGISLLPVDKDTGEIILPDEKNNNAIIEAFRAQDLQMQQKPLLKEEESIEEEEEDLEELRGVY